jgi:hypothetical protein
VFGNLSSAGDRFGSSVAFNQNGDWLYVGAPGNDLVYIYGLNRFVPIEQSTISVNNDNEIFFSSNITFSVNDVLTQPATGATATIYETSNVAVANVKVSSLTNFVYSANVTLGNSTVLSGNLYVNGIDAGVYPLSSTSTPVRNTFDISIEGTNPFSPYVANDPTSLLITTANQTFIANVDYTLSGNTVTFIGGPIEPSDLSIQQKPYYTLLTTVSGNVGSQFGYALSSSFDGAQLAVGAPNDDVLGLAGAGSVWVFDRQIEAFKSTGNVDYTTKNPINKVFKITIDGIEVTDYELVSYDSLTFSSNISASPGDYITQPATGGMVKVIGVTSATNLTVSYLSDPALFLVGNIAGNVSVNGTVVEQYTPARKQIYFSGNVSANIGDVIRQTVSGANASVVANSVGNTVTISYNTSNVFVLSNVANVTVGNITTTGSDANVYPTNIANLGVYATTTSALADFYTVRFITPPEVGKVIFIETNRFELLEKLIGVNSLEGGTSEIQEGANFGTDLTICSNNCAIYIGAPYYDNGANYNTGAVWKFHSRGRLYGTNNGYTVNPIFQPGDTFRLDNFDIEVSGSMTSVAIEQSVGTGYGNILTLSGNVRANVGDYITQSISGANITVLSNTSVSGSQYITVGNINPSTGLYRATYNTANMFTFGTGNISINGVSTTVRPMASLDSFINDINSANVLGVTALNENGVLRLNSDATVAKNLLRILAGTNSAGSDGILATADMRVFAFMQIIINPYNASGEYFGNKVQLASNAYMLVIGSSRGTTRKYTTIDSEDTIFDDDSTRLFDTISGSGSVYIYELYDDPRNEVEDPGRYAFAQQLDTGDLMPGIDFGAAVDIAGGYVTVSSPGMTVTIGDNTYTRTGEVYIFENPNRTRGWNLIRYQQPKVDIDSVNRIFLYNKDTNTILINLELIDPAKGRILGQAEQEISFKTEYDPAYYNKGDQDKFNISPDLYWGSTQVGKVWWNLNKVRFLEYEQDVLAYRRVNWGRLFPGSTVEICEWVESTVLPSEYEASGADGVPIYADNSAYVELIYVDNVTNIIGSKYYYWVKNKTTVDPNDETRTLPIQSIVDLVSNPKGQGIAYAAVIDSNAIILYNVGQYLSAKNTILHIDYEYVKGSNIIHSEYELLQKNNPNNEIPRKITNKLIDSLAGINATGDVVPDPTLSEANRYGISIRPRQSMFIDRLAAISEMVDHVNALLVQYPVAKDSDLTQLLDEDPIPSERSGEYDQIVETRTELDYIDTIPLATGYRIIVRHDSTQDNLWVMYSLTENDVWEITKVQTYKTSMYWSYVDWYAEKSDGSRYSIADKITYVVPSLVEALKLPYAPGDIIRIENTGNGLWQQVLVNDQSQFDTIGIQNGTIQLSQSLGNFAENSLGFGNQGYESNRFDQNPNIEIRSIVESLRDSIFKGNLLGEFNNLFFTLVNYLFEEQKYTDWIFKTSFISIVHNIRALTQYPNYVKDNQTYYQDYINEVKPYRTKIREYTLDYTGNDAFEGDVTDFDLPPYYDTSDKIFRSPSGEMVEKDEALWQTYSYNQWYQNRNLTIDSILVELGGSGYISAPTIVIDGGGANVQATAEAVIDGDSGAVIAINIINYGSGYTTTPTVLINGTNTTPARAYAVLKNNKLRTFDTVLKFDRVSYTSMVQEWSANTAYTRTLFDANGKVISGDIITYAVLENEGYIRKAYSVNANVTTGNSFVTSDFTLFAANAFTNANDRIMGYYQPSGAMPARDLAQLLSGIEYPGVKVQGLNFDQQPGIGGTTFANLTLNSSVTWSVGNVVTQPGADAILTFDNPITATAGDFITQNYLSGANATVFSSVSESLTVTVRYNNGIAFEIPNPLDSVEVINSNIQLNGSNIMLPGYTELVPSDTSATDTPYSIVTDSLGAKYVVVPDLPVRPLQTESAPLPTMTITTVWSSNKITGKIETTADFMIGIGNIKIDGTNQAGKYPTDVTYISSVISGMPFDTGSYDNFEYDEDGIAVLSDNVVDTIIRSNYTDLALGTRAEDIDVDGGAYVDRYSSHAPEEMVPGIVFDTLDMKVFTTIESNTKVLGYRIFHNMLRDPSYLRIADAYSTTLAQPLSISDLEIYVTDASVLPEPSPYDTIPGVVFINGERITYWQIDYTENKLMQIRRGTEGTAIPILQPTGATVVDASQQQVIPDTSYGNIGYNINVWYNDGTGLATDGTGFEGSTTDAVEFLKASEATNTVKVTVSDELVTEDAINTLTTEDDTAIFEEDQQ